MILTEKVVQQVWEKGIVVKNNSPVFWRKDRCGAWMKRSEYGNRASSYGWEIDYITVDQMPGVDNFQPLQWKNQVNKADNSIVCQVTSQGIYNTDKITEYDE